MIAINQPFFKLGLKFNPLSLDGNFENNVYWWVRIKTLKGYLLNGIKMVQSEEKMIGYCGFNCYLCAARSDDLEIRTKLVNAWRKYLGHESYTPENVACKGCKSRGDTIADKQCKVRPCAQEKGLDSCSQCNEFPCEKIKKLMGTTAMLLVFLSPKLKNVTEEEFNLCIKQWNSAPNLVKNLVKEGKLPSFVLNRI